MKKFLALTAALVVLSAGSAFALISTSAHDFTGTSWTNDICAPCHTPHNAVSGAGPLWAHSSATAADFVLYGNPFGTMETTTVAPSGISLACLSCHDGVTNTDAFIGTTGPGTNTIGAVAANLGTDLSNDHPIEITITDALYQIKSLAEISTAGLPLTSADVLTCATCHDVHNGTTNASMLRVTPVGSAICLSCHEK